MTIRLIGAHHSWSGEGLAPSQRERFAAALGIVGPRPAETHYDGATLLASTGQQRGWRPHVGPDGSRVLFAGHISNRQQLAKDLGMAPGNDEALYAAGFAAWGDAIDLRAIGQFATIVVPAQEPRVRLARSPVAAPPLLYWQGLGSLIATSFIGAIFATGKVPRQVDYQMVAETLYFIPDTGTRSYFAEVCRLPAGHRATITPESVALEAYYDLTALPDIRMKDDRDYLAAARALLEEGVSAALDGFSRPGISLSGGLDSQAGAAFMAKLRPGETIEAFTCVPEAGWDGVVNPRYFGDERPHVEALIAMYPQIKPHWIDAADLPLDHKRSSVFLTAGESGPALLGHMQHALFAEAQASGCDVMIEMAAGNHTFSFAAQGVLPEMARHGQWRQLWREARHLGRAQSRSALHVVANQALLPHAPEWLHNLLARLLGRHDLLGSDPYTTWCALNRDYAKRSGVELRAGPDAGHNQTRLPRSSRLSRFASLGQGGDDWAECHQAFELMYNIERRDPSSYRPLVEFCLGIPGNQYLRNGQTRWLARRMLEGLVPQQVVEEERRGMRVADWHLRIGKQRGALIAEFDHLLKDETITEIIDVASLRQALVDWPDKTPELGSHERLVFAVLDGLNMAQFIRFAEGRN